MGPRPHGHRSLAPQRSLPAARLAALHPRPRRRRSRRRPGAWNAGDAPPPSAPPAPPPPGVVVGALGPAGPGSRRRPRAASPAASAGLSGFSDHEVDDAEGQAKNDAGERKDFHGRMIRPGASELCDKRRRRIEDPLPHRRPLANLPGLLRALQPADGPLGRAREGDPDLHAECCSRSSASRSPTTSRVAMDVSDSTTMRGRGLPGVQVEPRADAGGPPATDRTESSRSSRSSGSRSSASRGYEADDAHRDHRREARRAGGTPTSSSGS